MPYRRRSRRIRRRPIRRRVRRRRRTRRSRFSGRQIIRRMPTALPDMVRMPMRYSFTMHVTGSIIRVFRGNSPYDPDFTGVGHQPAYYDWLSSIYRNYYCYASSIRTKYTNYNDGGPVQLCVTPGEDLTLSWSSTFSRQRELPRSKCRLVAGGASQASAVIKHRSSTRKMAGFGYDKSACSADRFANPIYTWYWNVGVTAFTAATPNGHLDCDLVLYVLFYNRDLFPTQD